MRLCERDAVELMTEASCEHSELKTAGTGLAGSFRGEGRLTPIVICSRQSLPQQC
jgi:hypothetical protein